MSRLRKKIISQSINQATSQSDSLTGSLSTCHFELLQCHTKGPPPFLFDPSSTLASDLIALTTSDLDLAKLGQISQPGTLGLALGAGAAARPPSRAYISPILD